VERNVGFCEDAIERILLLYSCTSSQGPTGRIGFSRRAPHSPSKTPRDNSASVDNSLRRLWKRLGPPNEPRLPTRSRLADMGVAEITGPKSFRAFGIVCG
jgi:hypothetical protein